MLMKLIHFIGYDGAEKYVTLFAITNDDLLALYKQEGQHEMSRFRKIQPLSLQFRFKHR